MSWFGNTLHLLGKKLLSPTSCKHALTMVIAVVWTLFGILRIDNPHHTFRVYTRTNPNRHPLLIIIGKFRFNHFTHSLYLKAPLSQSLRQFHTSVSITARCAACKSYGACFCSGSIPAPLAPSFHQSCFHLPAIRASHPRFSRNDSMPHHLPALTAPLLNARFLTSLQVLIAWCFLTIPTVIRDNLYRCYTTVEFLSQEFGFALRWCDKLGVGEFAYLLTRLDDCLAGTLVEVVTQDISWFLAEFAGGHGLRFHTYFSI